MSSTSRPNGPHLAARDSSASSSDDSDTPINDFEPRSRARPGSTSAMAASNSLVKVHSLGSSAATAQKDFGNKADGKPKLSRAKRDFGPRRDDHNQDGHDDAAGSGDGEWKIRHGFENQLNSEEYNKMLESVRRKLKSTTAPSC